MGVQTANAIIGAMKPFSKIAFSVVIAIFPWILAACGGEVTLSPTLAWTPLPQTSTVPAATATPPAAQVAPQVNPVSCVDDAAFLEDLTIPDETIVAAGELLDKRWSVQNSGSCNWDSGYRLVRVGNDGFGAEDEQALYPARAGSVAVWQVLLSAPVQPGEHISIWQARSPQGALFGEQVYLWVMVATPTPAPTSRGTPTN